MDQEIKSTGKIRCAGCGCAFEPEPVTQTEGDIEYTFFRCGFCGKAYMVSVTDQMLRDGIAEYMKLAQANRAERLPEPEQFRMQKLKAENLKRARELYKRAGRRPATAEDPA